MTECGRPFRPPCSPTGPSRPFLTTHRKEGGSLRLIVFDILAAISSNLAMIAAPAEEVAAGQKWLALVDDQKYEENWNQASSMFRSEVTQDRPVQKTA